MSDNFFSYKGKSSKDCATLNLDVNIHKVEKISTLFESDNKAKSFKYLPEGMLAFVALVFSSILVSWGGPTLRSTIKSDEYSVFNSKPLVSASIDMVLNKKDSRAEKIDAVFKKFNCPLAGLGNVFVEKADENNIPYTLVASVAFQESSCGKATPKVRNANNELSETYNLFGWGVWGSNIHKFDSYENAVDVVSKYFQKKFYSKNITDTCDIMRIYTPPSDGSWCKGVNYFTEIIENFEN